MTDFKSFDYKRMNDFVYTLLASFASSDVYNGFNKGWCFAFLFFLAPPTPSNTTTQQHNNTQHNTHTTHTTPLTLIPRPVLALSFLAVSPPSFGGGLPHRPPWMGSDLRGHSLFRGPYVLLIIIKNHALLLPSCCRPLTQLKRVLLCDYLVVVSETTQGSKQRNSVIVPAA